jgi:hypothetical protein
MLPMEGEEPPFTRCVSYEECEAAGRKNVAKTERLVFKPFNEHKDVKFRGVVDDRFIDISRARTSVKNQIFHSMTILLCY